MASPPLDTPAPAPRDAPQFAPDAERLLGTLLEQSPDGVLVTRPDGAIVRANPAACRMLGRTEAEIRRLGRSGLVVADERLRTFLEERDRNGLAHGEVVHRRADGSTYVAEETSAVIPTARGDRYAYIVFRDVTARRRAEEALQRYELLAANTRDMLLWIRREDGRILEANAAAAAAYGYAPEELRELTIRDLRAPGTLELTGGQMAAADEHGIQFETVHRRKDGSTFPVEVSSQGATMGGVRTLISVVRDITDRKRAEEALRESDRRKTEFLGVLSHELRNPLAPIRNGVAILARAPPGSEEAARARAILERQTVHLARIVDDLLDVTRISQGKIALQRAVLDARQVVGRSCDDHRPLFDAQGVALRFAAAAAPVWVDADATRVAQIAGNLLQNALRYTPSGRGVEVSVRSGDGWAELRVRDEGSGVARDDLARIFDRFVQARGDAAGTRGGLGLGLALVKGLAELHGGGVAASSDGLGRGAEFTVRLPLTVAPRASEEGSPVPAARAGRVVLVVDDNADAAQSLADLLELGGHTVHVALDGRTALALAARHRPEVVLCDIGLPDLSGYDVARALRADAALRATRLVALSGYAQPQDRARAREAGFDVHLAKPPRLEELEAALDASR